MRLKGKRQEKILELIDNNIILTQEELQNALNKSGFNVTQSTVSRDIKELRLIKGHDAEGNYRYVTADRPQNSDTQPMSHYIELISKTVKSVDSAMNNIVIKCYNGMASSVCVAIDIMFGERMLGSVAGDDTILVVTRNDTDAVQLTKEIKKMI